MNELLQRGRTVYHKTSRTYLRTGIFTLLLGAVFFLLGISSLLNSRPNYFLLVIGILFIGWGISHFFSAKRLGQK